MAMPELQDVDDDEVDSCHAKQKQKQQQHQQQKKKKNQQQQQQRPQNQNNGKLDGSDDKGNGGDGDGDDDKNHTEKNDVVVKQENEGKQKKKEKKKENEGEEERRVVLEARMHCQACRVKVFKAIIGYPGVEDVHIDMEPGQKVTVKTLPRVDGKKLFEAVKKKSGGKITKLLNAHPNPTTMNNKNNKDQPKKSSVDVVVTLKANMHCGECCRKVEKAAWKIGGVSSVKVEGETVLVTGKDLNPTKVCQDVGRRSGKHLEIVKSAKNEPKKESGDKKSSAEGGGKENNKDEGQKKDGGKERENNKDGVQKKDGNGNGNGHGHGNSNSGENKKSFHAKKEEKRGNTEALREYVYYPTTTQDFDYHPQYFSDENPNACTIM